MTNRRRTARKIAAAAAFLLLVAGCGGNGSPRVASVGSSTTTATTAPRHGAAAAVAYSRCMRANGVPTFPDLTTRDPQALKATVQHLSLTNPRFSAARSACRHLLPNGGQSNQAQPAPRIADMLAFARCMRSQGVTRFPDPSAQGELTVAMVEAQGIDVHSPAVLHAVQACLPATHGALTPAKVRAAINRAS